LTDHGSSIVGTDPGLVDIPGQDLAPATGSPCIDAAGPLAPDAVPDHMPVLQYLRHGGRSTRPVDGGALDLGALEHGLLFADGLECADLVAWSASQP
jgi:hypothetical protein